MAKKKSRSANVARKREKRKRNRKFKHKQLAIEKQRRSSHEKLDLDEKRIITCLIKGGDLLEEPEFDDLYFDFDMMNIEMLKLMGVLVVSVNSDSQVSTEITTSRDKKSTEPDIISDKTIKDLDSFHEFFCKGVIPNLITPKFMQSMFSVLGSCENRFSRIGDHEKVEIVKVTESFFQNMTPDEIVGHPLVQGIGIRTLQIIVEQPEIVNKNDPKIREVISDILETVKSKSQQNETSFNIISDTLEKESSYANVVSETVDDVDTLTVPTKSDPDVSKPILSINSLSAKALYKNNNGLAIKEILKEWQGYTLENETPTQLNYYNENQQLYITATNNRLQLHAHSEEELTVAMEGLETHCQSALMYLAKTYDEGGKINGTE